MTQQPEPLNAPPPAPPPPGAQAAAPGFPFARLAPHLVAGLLGLAALGFTVWFTVLLPAIHKSPATLAVLRALFYPWHWGGGSLDARGLAWGALAVVLFTVIGWFYLEGLELYLPLGATLALAYCLGLGLAGFVFESLAIPGLLGRAFIAVGLGLLLALLAVRAWRRAGLAPESGQGGDPGPREHLMRRRLAREAFTASLTRPRSPAARVFEWTALTLIGLISFLLFWHALLYPEVYWDSLILYMGYARQTFLEGGFPVKVTGQVGIGLGANYPHLYAVLGAAVAVVADHWSELPQRLMAPLAGLASTVLVYAAALRLTRHRNFSLAIALIYRAVPLGIIYDQYGSDYALVLLFTAAFLYLSLLTIETALSGALAAAAMAIALAMHLNYLMGILWLSWGMTVALAHVGMRAPGKVQAMRPPLELSAPWTALEPRPTLLGVLALRRFWLPLLAALALASTWHLRNWIVTGNPVYAFFYKILGGAHINPAVMEAAAKEWQANGAGIGSLGATLGARLRATWGFFVGPLSDGRFWTQAYQTGPLVMGFALGGALVWLGRLCAAPWAARRWDERQQVAARFGLVVATLTFALFAFHYALAPFYLYQIISVLPCLALLAALAFPIWRLRPWGWLLGALALWIGLMPGVVLGLMGFKLFGPIELPGGVTESPYTLYPLRHPLPEPRRFYRWRFGEDARMWEYINAHLLGERLLTHENRDLVLDPSITIVNLDDWTDQWNIQALWEIKDPAERVRRLMARDNIHYYLRVPNEDACPTNARMGAADWPKLGLAKEIFVAGENRLYELEFPSADRATTGTLTGTAATTGTATTPPAPVATPAQTPLATPASTQTPAATPTAKPTPSVTPSPTPTPRLLPTATATPTPPATPAPSPTPAPIAAPSSTPPPHPPATPAPLVAPPPPKAQATLPTTTTQPVAASSKATSKGGK